MKIAFNQNYLQQITDNQEIAFNKDEFFLWSQTKSELLRHIDFIEKSESSSWVLFHAEPLEFLIRLLALLVCHKKVILPANQQSETLKQIDSLLEKKIPLYPTKLDTNSMSESARSLTLPLDSQLLLFTSGSSGQPKSVTKTLDNLLSEIGQLETLWGDSFDRVVATVSHQHLYGLLFRLLWPFFTQKVFSNVQFKYPEELVAVGDKTALVTSPAILSRLDKEVNYQTFSEVFSSGGPLEFKWSKQTKTLLGVKPIEVYGSTETGGVGFRRQLTTSTDWQLFPKVELKLQQAECIVSSPFIFESELSLDDRLELTSDQEFRLLGRKDRIIKFEEKRLSLEQMEHYLLKSPLVEWAKCLVLEQKRSVLAVAIVLSYDGKNKLQDLGKQELVKTFKLHLLELFELVVIPKKWRFIDTMPTNSMNKVVMSEIKELFK